MKFSSAILIFPLLFLTVFASPVEKRRLIKTSEEDPGSWLSEDEVVSLRLSGKPFVDITNDREFTLSHAAPPKTDSIPSNPRFQAVVRNLINASNRTRVQNFLREFTSFQNRHANSVYGVQSQQWLFPLVTAALGRHEGDKSYREFSVPEFRQKSIVARIEGVHPQLKNEVVIIGAHQDSIAGGVNDSAPGADDNASGSSVILEVARLIGESGVRTNRSIEFHWYAAEEQGLLGSAVVAAEYARQNVTVAGMLNLDVVGWQGVNITDIGVFTDNANDELVQFVRNLVDEYLDFGRGDRSCGYACSDHASWTRNGYPALFVGEFQPNGHNHTPGDTYETVSFEQIMEVVKLALGFVIEIAEPL